MPNTELVFAKAPILRARLRIETADPQYRYLKTETLDASCRDDPLTDKALPNCNALRNDNVDPMQHHDIVLEREDIRISALTENDEPFST
jgi:hypothetical protein